MVTIDPDFSPEVIADLYAPRPRRLWKGALLAVFLGPLGAHRFYCGKPITATLMLMTIGGGLLWWIWDLFNLRSLIKSANDEDTLRRDQGLPPRSLAFLPPQDQLDLRSGPAWARHRSGKGRVVGSALLLSLFGISLGAISAANGSYEPVLILTLFIVTSLVAARWEGARDVPLVSSLMRWIHRLRLYYHTVDPGNVWLLALRPLFSIFIAPWRPKARAEVRLYLQFGALLAGAFALEDFLELLQSGGIASGIGLLVVEFLQTLLYTYLFVAPAGALLNTQLLLAKRDFVVWTLSAIALASIFLGMAIVSGS